MSGIQGVNHIGLSVADVEHSASWYERVFDVKRVFEDKGDTFQIVLVMVGPVAVGLIHKTGDAGDAFTEFRTGMDHLGFGVGTKKDVEDWKTRLDSLGVASSAVITDPFGHHLNFRDPDNIALEIFAPAG